MVRRVSNETSVRRVGWLGIVVAGSFVVRAITLMSPSVFEGFADVEIATGKLHYCGANITLMVQFDILAYHPWGSCSATNLLRLRNIWTLEVAYLVANVFSSYDPELKLGLAPACCSDRQPFHEVLQGR